MARFWLDCWLEAETLEKKYLRLLFISTKQNEVVENMGNWVGEGWVWDLRCWSMLFQWEEELAQNFKLRLKGVVIKKNGVDSSRWCNQNWGYT